jgi:hypothetical protein
MRTPQMTKTEKIFEGIKFVLGKPNTFKINAFDVQSGVPFELRIDVPSEFEKEGEGVDEVKREKYRAQMNYDAGTFILEFGLDRKYFPFWKIQAINVCLQICFI